MNREEAKKVLDQAREGSPVGEDVVCLALRITGDLGTHEAVRSPRVDQEVPAEDWRSRCRERAIMVGRSLQ